MPTISYFYGITIAMRPRGKEHNPPHIHALMGGRDASFSLITGEIVAGHFPCNGTRMVKEFILKNQDALLDMWETGNYRKIEPLD